MTCRKWLRGCWHPPADGVVDPASEYDGSKRTLPGPVRSSSGRVRLVGSPGVFGARTLEEATIGAQSLRRPSPLSAGGIWAHTQELPEKGVCSPSPQAVKEDSSPCRSIASSVTSSTTSSTADLLSDVLDCLPRIHAPTPQQFRQSRTEALHGGRSGYHILPSPPPGGYALPPLHVHSTCALLASAATKLAVAAAPTAPPTGPACCDGSYLLHHRSALPHLKSAEGDGWRAGPLPAPAADKGLPPRPLPWAGNVLAAHDAVATALSLSALAPLAELQQQVTATLSLAHSITSLLGHEGEEPQRRQHAPEGAEEAPDGDGTLAAFIDSLCGDAGDPAADNPDGQDVTPAVTPLLAPAMPPLTGCCELHQQG